MNSQELSNPQIHMRSSIRHNKWILCLHVQYISIVHEEESFMHGFLHSHFASNAMPRCSLWSSRRSVRHKGIPVLTYEPAGLVRNGRGEVYWRWWTVATPDSCSCVLKIDFREGIPVCMAYLARLWPIASSNQGFGYRGKMVGQNRLRMAGQTSRCIEVIYPLMSIWLLTIHHRWWISSAEESCADTQLV